MPYQKGAVVAMIVWWLDIQLAMQSVPITINILSLNPAHGGMYSIQHCDCLSVTCGRSKVFSDDCTSTNKTDHHDVTVILLKVC